MKELPKRYLGLDWFFSQKAVQDSFSSMFLSRSVKPPTHLGAITLSKVINNL